MTADPRISEIRNLIDSREECVRQGYLRGDELWLTEAIRAIVDREPTSDSETQWGCRDRHGTVHTVGVENEAQAHAMRSMTPVRREVGPWTEVQP